MLQQSTVCKTERKTKGSQNDRHKDKSRKIDRQTERKTKESQDDRHIDKNRKLDRH